MAVILSSDEIVKELESYIKPDAHSPPRDARYACPNAQWLREFSKWCQDNCEQYTQESFDCDDFALLRMVDASKAIRRSRKLRGLGHAVMYCDIIIASGTELNGVPGGGRHACLLVRTEKSWVFFEPQNGQMRAVSSTDSVLRIPYVFL